MTTLANSFTPVHPGEIFKEELQARGISQKKIAEMTQVSYTMLNEILNGKRQLSAEVALVFEAALGISADMLIGIQTRYNLQVARDNSSYKRRLDSIRKVCASLL
ncbi:MAG: HigA family addiction module antitoxin [Rikenellaceae bacterium]